MINDPSAVAYLAVLLFLKVIHGLDPVPFASYLYQRVRRNERGYDDMDIYAVGPKKLLPASEESSPTSSSSISLLVAIVEIDTPLGKKYYLTFASSFF